MTSKLLPDEFAGRLERKENSTTAVILAKHQYDFVRVEDQTYSTLVHGRNHKALKVCSHF